MNTNRQSRIRLRAGYTLIELLIVVAIIGIMLSLSIVVMFGITDQASEEATVTTIQKVNRLLELRIDSFDRAFPASAVNGQGHLRRMLPEKSLHAKVFRQRELLRFSESSPVIRRCGRSWLGRLHTATNSPSVCQISSRGLRLTTIHSVEARTEFLILWKRSYCVQSRSSN